MKTTYFLIGILILSSMVLVISPVTAVEEDEEYTWEVKTVDREKLADYFGFESDGDPTKNYQPPYWGSDVGDQTKLKVSKIEEDKVDLTGLGDEFDMIIITYDSWGVIGGGEQFYEDPNTEGDAKDTETTGDDEGEVDYIPEDPKDASDIGDATGDPITGINLPYVLPVDDVEDYLDDIKWEGDWDSDGLEITYDGDDPDEDGFEDANELDEDGDKIDHFYKITYTAEGVLSSLQLLNDDDEVMYELGLKGAIPGYTIPIFLGVAAAATIGLIYTIIKRA